MIVGGAWAMLLLAAQAPAPPPQGEAPQQVQADFAPPTDRPMLYRITSRRPSRDGSMISFTQVYALQWQRVGRGYLLAARLDRLESDARPELVRAFTQMMQPLIGETLTYAVSADGRQIDSADVEGLWQRVLARVQADAAQADRPEAKQAAQMIAALTPEQREQIATSDIRALVASGTTPPVGADVRTVVTGDGAIGTMLWTETATPGGRVSPIRIEWSRSIDRATGLLVEERRRSWLTAPDGGAGTLADEHVRTLTVVSAL